MAHEQKDIERRESMPERMEGREPLLIPATDIYEREDALVIMADMPGADESTVDLNIDRNVLTVRGHCACEAPVDHDCTYSEYSCGGQYERSFTLSGQIDTGRIEATVRDGVLKVILPKAEEAKPRRIEVKGGEH
jgi:HSP20 family protein